MYQLIGTFFAINVVYCKIFMIKCCQYIILLVLLHILIDIDIINY